MKYIILLLIIFNVVLSARWIIDGNLFFHTDIARDFLLMEDIVNNKHLTLIGPRSGAIPGLFHGPLWLYLNLPAFVIGGGNPVIVGWFWVALYILGIFIAYYVGKKLFGGKEGILSALLLSSVTILNVRSLFNPYGALMLSPIFFYLFINYLLNQKVKYLIISFLILGFIIQFQMAFGVPLALLSCLYLFYILHKNKKLFHLPFLLISLLPLSSHILFEIRNNFLQIRSVLSYLNGQQSHGKLDLNLFQLVLARIREMFMDGLGTITQNNPYITAFLLFGLIFAVLKVMKEKTPKKHIYLLFIYFYLGFWIMTVFFKGPLWNYYYIPFIPLLVLIFVSVKSLLNKWIFYALFFLIYLINVHTALKDILAYNPNTPEQDVSTWKFNELVARSVFKSDENEFGYFIFTPDLYGYSPRYALDFYQKQNTKKRVTPYQKQRITYLIIAPPPEYGKDPNSVWYQKNINSNSWKINDVKITAEPLSKISFKNGFVIEKYHLSEDEIKIEPNPYLIKDIFFR